MTSKQTFHKIYLKRREEEKQESLFCFYYRLSIREELCYASSIGNNTITGSTDLLQASYRKFHWKLIIGALRKGQFISKAKFSFEPKTERKYFCISALASKMVQIKKIMAHYYANL